MKYFSITRHPELLFLDNAPTHSTEFNQAYATVIFSPPNDTSWKQSMDMSIIGAHKKR